MTFDPKPIADMAKHVMARRPSDPILDLVLLRDGTATMTDLDQTITLDMPDGPAAPVLVPRDLLAKAGRDHVTIDGTTANVAGVAVNVATDCQIDDWPHMAPVTGDPAASMALPLGDLRAMLRDVAPAMSDEETRYYLRGVHFNGRQESTDAPPMLRLEATQGHFLLAASSRHEWPAKAILPRRAVVVLLALPGGDDAPVAVTFHEHGAGRFIFEGPGWRFETKAVDGTFPTIERAFPRPDQRAGPWTVAADDVADMVKRLARFVDKDARAITFDMATGAASMKDGKASTALPGAVVQLTDAMGQPGLSPIPGQTVGVDANYLRTMVAIAKGQGVVIGYAAEDPWLIEYEDRPSHALVGVIMPMRQRMQQEERKT